jgi:hypothetical protein
MSPRAGAPSRRSRTLRALGLLAALALGAPGVRAQVDVSVEPAMTKGPRGAPVIILEFSDYQ